MKASRLGILILAALIARATWELSVHLIPGQLDVLLGILLAIMASASALYLMKYREYTWIAASACTVAYFFHSIASLPQSDIARWTISIILFTLCFWLSDLLFNSCKIPLPIKLGIVIAFAGIGLVVVEPIVISHLSDQLRMTQ